MRPLPRHPHTTLLLAPELFGSVDRYLHIARHARVAVDTTLRFDKRRKQTHRFTIADTRGPLHITIPIAKPDAYHTATLADILISGHSPWWDTIPTALESAYGRTPFFEFYIDSLRPYFTPSRVGTPLLSLTTALESTVCTLLTLPPPTLLTTAASTPPASATADFRRGYPAADPMQPYWQVRQSTLGFIPRLSILDLLFNLGPEAPLYLYRHP